ncbi:serine protease [Thalassotalea sp. 1_MG-2023]|uniref:S1 family peptidase n=1 Tax=Thalassotalea sp. 1_MG-2023 TaxID=3062680 RepID=UPI0026E334C7|nr:serine protease [Thalassotalea sp. 1_MG-2023]MDO6425595.1 serine protease [Thalassotalea sp. 1_MG-2023]
MIKWIMWCYFALCGALHASELADTLEKIKPSVVGIGVYTPTGRPKNQLHGTGFVIGNGKFVVTNHHVVPESLNVALKQQLAVFVGSGRQAVVRKARLIDSSAKYDLAVLAIEGDPLPAMTLSNSDFIREGSYVAFTGFPIGAVLGLYPVTHRGIVASITPTITPVADAKKINIAMLKRLRDPYLVYQLDATAYPGNSGSALYEVSTGKVVGVINKVFVQKTKEGVITNPSGITYAIPIKYVIELLEKNKITFK